MITYHNTIQTIIWRSNAETLSLEGYNIAAHARKSCRSQKHSERNAVVAPYPASGAETEICLHVHIVRLTDRSGRKIRFSWINQFGERVLMQQLHMFGPFTALESENLPWFLFKSSITLTYDVNGVSGVLVGVSVPLTWSEGHTRSNPFSLTLRVK